MADEEKHESILHPEYWFLPEWARKMSEQLERIDREIHRMTDDQTHLDADVQALTDGLTNVEAEIASLKNQPAAAGLDFTSLDAAVARLQGDETAPVVAPTPDPTPDPTPVTTDPTPSA